MRGSGELWKERDGRVFSIWSIDLGMFSKKS